MWVSLGRLLVLRAAASPQTVAAKQDQLKHNKPKNTTIGQQGTYILPVSMSFALLKNESTSLARNGVPCFSNKSFI